jgi:ketosteroid isomerase-like protein
MSLENVEIVRRAFDGWNRGEGDVSAWFHPDVEVGGPDVPGVYCGYDGLRRFRDDQLSVWDYFHLSVDEFIERGGNVLALTRGRGRGKVSGAEIEQRVAHLCTVQDGKIRRLWIFQDREKALEAVGLRE